MDVHWPCHDVIKFAWSRKRKVAKTHLLFKMKWACLVSYPFLIKMNKIFQIILSKCSNISILPRFGWVKHLRTTFPHRIWDVRVMTSFNDIKVTLLSSWYVLHSENKKRFTDQLTPHIAFCCHFTRVLKKWLLNPLLSHSNQIAHFCKLPTRMFSRLCSQCVWV